MTHPHHGVLAHEGLLGFGYHPPNRWAVPRVDQAVAAAHVPSLPRPIDERSNDDSEALDVYMSSFQIRFAPHDRATSAAPNRRPASTIASRNSSSLKVRTSIMGAILPTCKAADEWAALRHPVRLSL